MNDQNRVDPLKGKRVLITGGSGFIAARLARFLLAAGSDIAVMTRPDTNVWRIADIMADIRVHQTDITDRDDVLNAFREYGPEYVFHLATYGAYGFQAEPDKIVRTNVRGTLNILLAAQEAGCHRVVVTGSSSEYGVVVGPMREDLAPAPVNVYGAAKVSATALCQAFCAAYGLPTVVLRLFSVYGAYEEPTRFIASLILAGLNGQSLKLTGGKQKRDFIYMEDVVAALCAAAVEPAALGQIINIGSGRESTLKDVGEVIMELMRHPVELQWGALPYREGEMWHWWADIQKAKRLLNWAPANDLRTGLKKTINWFTEHQGLFLEGNKNSATIRDFRDR